MKADFLIRRGEPLVLSLDVVDGDYSAVEEVVAKLKKAGPNGTVPPATAPVLGILTVAERNPSLGPGWTLVLPPEVSSQLEAGYYIVNASLTMTEGFIDKTEPVLIEVKGSVA